MTRSFPEADIEKKVHYLQHLSFLSNATIRIAMRNLNNETKNSLLVQHLTRACDLFVLPLPAEQFREIHQLHGQIKAILGQKMQLPDLPAPELSEKVDPGLAQKLKSLL